MVDGYNGDNIRILVGNKGVYNFCKLWRNIESKPLLKKKVISVEAAVDLAKKNSNKIYKKTDEVIPKSPELVLFSKSFLHNQTIMEPAWRVEIEKNTYVFINAYTGQLEEY